MDTSNQAKHLEPTQTECDELPKQFVYRPLDNPDDDIRLLGVLPGTFDGDLRCVLIHVNLTKAQGYRALSYVWGDPKLPRVPIRLAYYQRGIVDNISEMGQSFTVMPISPNLESALRNFRSKNNVQMIWADALCINQGDTKERQREVLKMGKIYSLAAAVLVWLGIPGEEPWVPHPNNKDPKDAVDAALTWFARLNSEYDPRDPARHPRDLGLENRSLWPSELAVYGILSLYSNPWFQRIWIIQEVTLATGPIRVCCGKRTVRLETMSNPAYFVLKLLRHLRKGVHRIPTRALNLRYIFTFFRKSESNLSLPERVIEALCTSSDFLATVEKDRLYGLLGMIGDIEGVSALDPDYTQSDDRFFEELARYLITSTGTAAILDAWRDHHAQPRSWIPSWKATGGPPYLPLTRARNITKLRFSVDGTRLHVNASTFGVVSYMKRLHSSEDPASLLKHLRDIEDELETSTSVSNADSLRQSDCLSQLLSQVAVYPVERDDFRERFRIFLGHSVWPGSLRDPRESKSADQEQLASHLKPIFTPHGTIFRTTTDRVGFSSGEIKCNDSFYWIAGCRNALAFRAHEGGIKVVGHCHFRGYHDMTEDEHFEMLDAGCWEEIVIV